MKVTSDQVKELLGLDDFFCRHTGLEIFTLENAPTIRPQGVYPIVDNTFRVAIFILGASGGHRITASRLGALHTNQEIRNINSRNRDEYLEMFLAHGYYWTSAVLTRSAKLICAKDFKPDPSDIARAYRWELSFLGRG
jgi:hypothetical protein